MPYISKVFPELADLCLEDAKDYDFEKDIVPIVNEVYKNKQTVKSVESTLCNLVNDLEEIIYKKFQKDIDVEIVLYVGLCNGAGWATEINGKNVVLLGIEKIIELDWRDRKHLIGLLYHELGHIFQKQHGILKRTFESAQNQFMWQLFVEGIAMYFEQLAVADTEFFHQATDDWKIYFDTHLTELKKDFEKDCAAMNKSNQRYFGDWVSYNGYSDAGYYLGARFIQFICQYENFMDILSFDIDDVKRYYGKFLGEEI